MPISDEIIELEPVKKSKTKLIIMFVIMGVLLALAITFLVLYLLKPNVEENTGRVNGVVGETSALFVDSTADGDVNLASVGNEYTVYADVSAEGTADPGVNWTWEPMRAITETGHGNLGEVVTLDGEGQSAPATRFYFSFMPSPDFADGTTPVTITARSMSDVNQRTEIKFFIINQATENIEIQKISHDGGAYANITYNDSGEISLPYYSNDKNNKAYAISFRQLGKFNPTTGQYSDLTKSSNGKDGQPTYKVDIVTDKADSVISHLRIVDGDGSNDVFRFQLCGTGVATITLTANNYNDFGEPVTATIKIKSESTETLGYIDDIRIYEKPIDDTDGKFYKEYVNKQYTMDNYGAIPRSSTTFVMPYNVPSYSNFLQHVVILPLSIQYNADGTRKSDWMNHINVTSSLNELLSVSEDTQKNVVLKTKHYGEKNTCVLTVTSTDKLGVIVSSAINVNVVAQNTQEKGGSISVKKEGQSKEEDIGKKISTAQGSSLDVSVVYYLTAPSDVDKETFVTSNCLSRNYIVSMKSVATGQIVKDFVLTSGTKNIEWDKTQTIDTAMEIVKVGTESSTRYTGTITFKLSIPNDRTKIPDGDYVFTFTKKGSPDPADKVLSDLDSDWSKIFTLSVTAKARTAKFIDEDKGAEFARLGGNSGNFVIKDEHNAILYLQNRSGSLHSDFSFKNFVEVTDGVSTINVTCAASGQNLTVTGSVGNQTFTFPGKKNWNDNNIQGTVTITAKNNAEEAIGTFHIDVYLIDAVKFISVEEAGVNSFVYNKNSIENSGISFQPNRIINDFIFLPSDNNEPRYREKKYNEKAHDNFMLSYRKGASNEWYAKVKKGDNIEFKYPDENGTTVFEYVNDSKSIYPRVDLFEFSYNNNIDATVLTVKYSTVPDDRFETEKDIKSCTRDYTFIRRADDIALFKEADYAESNRLTPDSDNHFKYEINMGANGGIYSSAVVNIKESDGAAVTPVVVRFAAVNGENKGFITNLGLEEVYMEKPGSHDGSIEVSGGTNGKYDYMTFRAPEIAGDEAKYTTIVHGMNDKYTLDIVVLNRARPIESIDILDDDKTTKLSKFGFGEFGNAKSYNKTFYIKATFVRFADKDQDDLYTQCEPIMLTLPSDKFVLTTGGVTYSGKDRYELIAPQLVTDEKNGYYYAWECSLTLANDVTDKSGGQFKITDKFADEGDELNYITASADITIGTGVQSIDFTVNNAKHNVQAGANHDVYVDFLITFASDFSQKIDIPFEVKPYSVSSGYASIAYDINNLTYKDSDDTVVGLNGGDGTLLGKLTLKLDKDNFKTLNEAYVFTLTDTSNGANTEFKITVHASVRADIYMIELANKYTVETNGADSTGADSDFVEIAGTITYNGGNANLQPDSEYKHKVEAKVVVGGEGSTTTADGKLTVKDFNKDTGEFKIAVANSVLNGTYSLRVAYTMENNTEIVKYVPIMINTTSNEVKWLSETEGNVEISNGTAAITVKNASDKFSFVAGVYNRGNGDRVNDGVTITYAIYDSANDRTNEGTQSTVAKVSGGIVNVINPAKTRDTIYLRASYVDASSGKTFYADVDITYTVVIASIKIEGLDADTYKDNAITLYYNNNSAYTTLDLAGKIKAETAFTGINPFITPTITIESGDTGYLTVNGLELTPKNTGSVKITVTAKGVGTLTKEYTVNIIGIDALELESYSGIIDIVKNGSVDVVRKVSDDKYGGLVGAYSVSSASSKINVVTASDNKTATVTINRASFGASDYITYTLTAKTVYTLKDGSSLKQIGTFSVSKNYTLTVDWSYSFDFELRDSTDTLISAGSVNEIKPGYKVVVTLPTDGWYTVADWTYKATDKNGIVTFGEFNNGEATLTFDTSKAGVISVSVKATAYGKSVDIKSKEYTFSYGKNFTTKLQSSSVGSGTFDDFADKDSPEKTLAVDFDDSTAKRIIRYVIDTSKIGDTVTDVNIDFVGTATAGEVKNSGNLYYCDFTLDAETTLILSGSFVVGGRTYITDKYTVTLTATAPDFNLTENSGKSELKAANKDEFETATFKVGNSASAFKGATNVTYSIVSGNDRADINATSGILTPKATANATGGSVVVCATITVTSGVFAGKMYTVDKIINIKGVALPTLTLINPSITTNKLVENTGTTVDLSNNTFTLSGSGDANCAYTYNYSYTVKEASNSSLVSDCSISGSTLTIGDTERTKAGGKIKVAIRATVTSEINKGAYTEKIIEVIILPRAHQSVATVNVSGAVGSYDINSAVRPYTYDAVGFVQSTDNYTVVYALAGSEDGISVSGDRLVISKAVTTEKPVTLNAKLTFNGDSAYKGTTIDVNGVTVNVCGFTFNPKTVAFADASYSDVTVNAAELGSTVNAITVTLKTNAGFASITDNGTDAVKISVDKDFNISSTTATKKIEYSAIVTVTKAGAICTYYGEGVIDVSPVEPELVVTINEKTYDSSSDYSLYVGDSFNLKFAEKHGFDIDSVTVGALGDGLTCVDGGVNQMFTALAVRASSAVEFDVVVSGVTVKYKLNIKVEAKPTVPAFTATNTSMNVLYKYVDSYYDDPITGDAISVLTPSSDYPLTKPRASTSSYSTYTYYIYTSNGYISNYISKVMLYGYDKKGSETEIASATPSGSRYLYLYADSSVTNKWYVKYKLVFTFVISRAGDFNLMSTFYWINDTDNSGKATGCSITYTIKRSSSTVAITYNSNGGTGVDSQSYSLGETVKAPSEPTKTGYDFAGWYTIPNPDPDDAADKKHVYSFGSTIYSSMTLYAGWRKKSYTVTYDPNRGTINGGETSGTAYYNEIYANLPADSVMDRDGYTFAGWWTDKADGKGVKVTSSSKCQTADNHTLYARWTANTYTVKFNAGIGILDALSTSKTVTYDSAYGTLPTPTLIGNTFKYWYYSNGNTETTVASGTTVGSEVLVDGGLTLYAKWEAKKDIVVTFNANGGKFTGGNTTTVDQTYNSSYKFPTEPTRAGYQFAGWVDADGKTVSTTVVNANNHTLYAKWTERTDITIKLNKNDGSAEESITRTFGEAYDLPSPTRTGYTFKYWYDAAGSDSTAFTAATVGSEALVTGGLTLKAKWEANTYYVFLNYNDGSGKTETISVIYGKSYSLPTPAARDGYTFGGWFNGSTPITSDTTVGSEVISGLTLKAKWEVKTNIVVTFNANGGKFASGNTTTVDQTYDGYYKLPTEPTRNGYTFVGWVDTNSKPVTTSTIVKNATSHTVTAKWEAKTCYVFLNYNDGSGKTEIKSFAYGGKYSLPTPTRSGYEFEYWYTVSGSTETKFTSTNVGSEALNGLILYAKWAKEVTVTFNPNGGSLGSQASTKTVLLGKAYGTLPEPTRTGYTFIGWHIGSENGTSVSGTTIVNTESNHTLYAKWEENAPSGDDPASEVNP